MSSPFATLSRSSPHEQQPSTPCPSMPCRRYSGLLTIALHALPCILSHPIPFALCPIPPDGAPRHLLLVDLSPPPEGGALVPSPGSLRVCVVRYRYGRIRLERRDWQAQRDGGLILLVNDDVLSERCVPPPSALDFSFSRPTDRLTLRSQTPSLTSYPYL
ncbi:hypothetical protein BD626DRAFT_229832 [Schizophyllum amplum]|uniref:Uncharacterized protein n=1 Tax=Schizophyllum amplum TaxID=97359 RepID=A0A550BWH3_9AGAR|nr:hypothetical protein BD626DRAFT_229832 [Auriculariopsis ampla]